MQQIHFFPLPATTHTLNYSQPEAKQTSWDTDGPVWMETYTSTHVSGTCSQSLQCINTHTGACSLGPMTM